MFELSQTNETWLKFITSNGWRFSLVINALGNNFPCTASLYQNPLEKEKGLIAFGLSLDDAVGKLAAEFALRKLEHEIFGDS